MAYICWICRRRIKQPASSAAPNWGKCELCTKTREQREPTKADKA